MEDMMVKVMKSVTDSIKSSDEMFSGLEEKRLKFEEKRLKFEEQQKREEHEFQSDVTAEWHSVLFTLQNLSTTWWTVLPT